MNNSLSPCSVLAEEAEVRIKANRAYRARAYKRKTSQRFVDRRTKGVSNHDVLAEHDEEIDKNLVMVTKLLFETDLSSLFSEFIIDLTVLFFLMQFVRAIFFA